MNCMYIIHGSGIIVKHSFRIVRAMYFMIIKVPSADRLNVTKEFFYLPHALFWIER